MVDHRGKFQIVFRLQDIALFGMQEQSGNKCVLVCEWWVGNNRDTGGCIVILVAETSLVRLASKRAVRNVQSRAVKIGPDASNFELGRLSVHCRHSEKGVSLSNKRTDNDASPTQVDQGDGDDGAGS